MKTKIHRTLVKLFFYSSMFYILITPIFPQIFGLKSVVIKEWIMYSYIGFGNYHIDAFEEKSNNWIDMNEVEGYRTVFKSEDKVKIFKISLLNVYPKANIIIKKSTPKGYVYIDFE